MISANVKGAVAVAYCFSINLKAAPDHSAAMDTFMRDAASSTDLTMLW
jgi:hypothetical protein